MVRGGLSTDAWGEVSTPTTFARGELHVQVPRGGRVRWARLFSGFTVFHDTARLPPWPPSVPAGPAGTPRQVILGAGASAITRTLEGVPRFYASTVPTAGRTAYWGTFITDVTAAVRAAVGPSSRGGVTNVAIQERGDDAPREDFTRIQIGGHFLAVVYDLDFGPRRNVVVYEGAATSGFESAALPLPGPVANRCPTTGFARAEPFAASIGVMWEFNRRPNAAAPTDPTRDTCTEEESQIFVNGNMLTSRAGGADDWPSVTPAMGCFGDTAGLATMGTFGGTEPGVGRAAGSPVGLDGDEILTTPALPRLDDELYDFRTVVRDAATAMQFRFGTDGDEMIPVIAFQTLARVSDADADGDGWSDVVEGDCTVDTDSDGTPDYLDTDSDNDCLPDMRESAAGRTNAALPGAPDLNCPTTAPVCDRVAGVCLCNADRDCLRGTATPVCDQAARTCVACSSDAQCAAIDPARPACATTGPSVGRCVPCTQPHALPRPDAFVRRPDEHLRARASRAASAPTPRARCATRAPTPAAPAPPRPRPPTAPRRARAPAPPREQRGPLRPVRGQRRLPHGRVRHDHQPLRRLRERRGLRRRVARLRRRHADVPAVQPRGGRRLPRPDARLRDDGARRRALRPVHERQHGGVHGGDARVRPREQPLRDVRGGDDVGGLRDERGREAVRAGDERRAAMRLFA